MNNIKNLKSVIAYIKNKEMIKAQDALSFLVVGASEKDVENLLQLFDKENTPESRKALTQFMLMDPKEQRTFIDNNYSGKQLEEKLQKVKEKFPEINEDAVERKALEMNKKDLVDMEKFQKEGKQLFKEFKNTWEDRQDAWDDALTVPVGGSLIVAEESTDELWNKINKEVSDVIEKAYNNKLSSGETINKLVKIKNKIEDEKTKHKSNPDIVELLEYQYGAIKNVLVQFQNLIKKSFLAK